MTPFSTKLLILLFLGSTIVVNCQQPRDVIELFRYSLDLNRGILTLSFDVISEDVNQNIFLQDRTRNLDYNLKAIALSNCGESCSLGAKENYYLTGGEFSDYYSLGNDSYVQEFNLSYFDLNNIVLHESIGKPISDSLNFTTITRSEIFIRIENNFIRNETVFFKQSQWVLVSYFVSYQFNVTIVNSMFSCTNENKFKFNITWEDFSQIQPNSYEISLRIGPASFFLQNGSRVFEARTFTFVASGNSFETTFESEDLDLVFSQDLFEVRLTPQPYQLFGISRFGDIYIVDPSIFEKTQIKFGLGVFTVTIPIPPDLGFCSRVIRDNLRCHNLSDGQICLDFDLYTTFRAVIEFPNSNRINPSFTLNYDPQGRRLFGIGFFQQNVSIPFDNESNFTLVEVRHSFSPFFYLSKSLPFNPQEIFVETLYNVPPLSIMPFCANDVYSEYNLIRVNSAIDFGLNCSGPEYLTISAIGKTLMHENRFTTSAHLITPDQQYITPHVLVFQNLALAPYFYSVSLNGQKQREEFSIMVGSYCPSTERYTVFNATYFLPFIAPNTNGTILATASENRVVIELRGFGFCYRTQDENREFGDLITPFETSNRLELRLETSLTDVAERISASCLYDTDFKNSIFYVCYNLTRSLLPKTIYSGQLNISSVKLENDVLFEDFEVKVSVESQMTLPVFSFPYGPPAKDIELPRETNVCGEELPFSTFLPAGKSIQARAYVTSNGGISLGSCGAGINPRPFPDASIQIPMLAAYWAYHDHREFGDVYYRYTVDPDTLANVSRIVQNKFNCPNFTADWAIIATWVNIPPHPADRSTFLKCAQFGSSYSEACERTNSYQSILVTDGAKSYFITEYLCGHVTWEDSMVRAVIGISLPEHYALHQFSGKTGVNRIGCLDQNGNNTLRNVVGYEVSLATYSNFIQDQLQMCKTFLKSDDEKFGAPLLGTFPIPCPCWKGQARFDRRFRTIYDFQPDTVCYQSRRSRGDSSVRCCYTRFQLNTQLSVYTRFSQIQEPSSYQSFDSTDFAIACSYSDRMSEAYYQVRKQDFCQGYRPPRLICIYGDPHYITLDDFEYTFNGFGEYVLVRTFPLITPSFELQGRTRPFGNVTEATILTGLAFQFNNHEIRMEILLEPSAQLKMRTTVAVNYGAPINLTQLLVQTGDNYSNASLDIEVDTSNNLLIILDGILTLTVSVKNGILDYLLALPPEHKYNTNGLMGTWNDNQEDDLTPFGTIIPISTNSSQRKIHYDFGQTWNVSITATPLFFYPPGRNSADYTNNTYVPAFSDEITYSPTVTALCGNNPPCLFDFQLTGNQMIAANTSNQNTDFFVQQMGVANFPPYLTLLNGSTDIRLIRGGEAHIFTVQVVDEDVGATLQVQSNHTVLNQTISSTPLSTQYAISLSLPQPANTPFSLSLIAYDVQGATASLHFDITACACQNGGMCRPGVYSFQSVSLRYKLEACQCPAGYDGAVCERDADGCVQQECYPGVTCTDLPPPSTSGQCGVCPLGTLGDGLTCTDVNECFNESGLFHTCMAPSQLCVNVVGSFLCECAAGYVQQTPGICVDIDECAFNPCQQMCVNTMGSYNCSCFDGFRLNLTTGACDSIVSCSLNCGANGVCGVEMGTERCFCDSGYEAAISGMCVDIDECANSLHGCEHFCTNIAKSYTCSCMPGYMLGVDSLSCDDFNECEDIFSVRCSLGDICLNTVGSHMCVMPTIPMTSATTTPSAATLPVSLIPLLIALVLIQAIFTLI